MNRLLARLFGTREPVALRAARWVVIDCETGGLDPSRDSLLSVGAVSVSAGRIEPGPGYGAVLRQSTPTGAANILVHGIGAQAQAAGRPAGEVLEELQTFIGDALPVAFHAPFDATALGRAMAGVGLAPPRQWLDLARLAPALLPAAAASNGGLRTLDDWLAASGIPCVGRHDALGDAYLSAQLLLVLIAEAERQGTATVEQFLRLERSARWLSSGL